jgi:hypothetical protein
MCFCLLKKGGSSRGPHGYTIAAYRIEALFNPHPIHDSYRYVYIATVSSFKADKAMRV